MTLTERLQNIEKKVMKLEKRDPNFQVFGAQRHKYALYPQVSEETLLDYEKKYQVKLPEGYRDFLKTVSNGGAGPYYGLYPLEYCYDQKYLTEHPEHFVEEFPYHQQDVNQIIETRSKQNRYAMLPFPSKNCGFLYLAEYGCGGYYFLVTTGDQHGKVWYHDGNGLVPQYYFKDGQPVQLDFLAWYEQWLDYYLTGGGLADNPAIPFDDPKEVKIVNYSNQKVKELPKFLFDCINLEDLKLDGNDLQEIPKEIGVFKNLKFLTACHNFNLAKLPEELGELKNLQYLYFKTAAIAALPESIGNLGELLQMDVSFNRLTQIPETIGKLKKLTYLNMENNQLSQLPDSIGELENLTDVMLTWNKLQDLPATFKNLKKIKVLSLRANQFQKIPEVLLQMLQLENLAFHENDSLDFVDTFTKLSKLSSLRSLSLMGTSLPKEIGLMKNLQTFTFFAPFYSQDPQRAPMVIPEEMGQLVNLTSLGLANQNIEHLPETFAQLKNLKEFFLEGNNFSDEEKTKIKKMLPNTEIFFEA